MDEKRLWFEAYCAAVTGFASQSKCSGTEAARWSCAQADLAVQDYRARFPDSPASDPPWTGHARVELMGHRSYTGRIRETEAYGSKLGEVQELLPSGEYGETHLFGGKSVYTIRTMSLENALKEVREVRKYVQCEKCSMFLVGGTSIGRCENECFPGCTVCWAGKRHEQYGGK